MTEVRKKADNETNLRSLADAVKALLEDEADLVAGLANTSALIKASVDDLNWAGFYLQKGNELVLGPFQGLPACSRIAAGKGVCGRAVLDATIIVVPDVSRFEGHLRCDAASASEMVVPLFRGGAIFGVLDLDSPRLNRFSALEESCFRRVGEELNHFLDRARG
ncbi:MAG: GAF domain-containing protein [Treponema sp.]|jgi:GAF domain-containing protein|nr:GAF domain-containing protein [Treponema sp.]